MSELSLFSPADEIRRCRNCGAVKLLTEFVRRAGIPSRTCKSCEAARSLAKYHANPEIKARQAKWQREHPRYYRNRALVTKYGITADEFDERAAEQGHVCAVCGQPCPNDQSLRVDHDHETGQVRGLLCHTCNVGLGMFRDNPELLMAAAQYVLKHTNVLSQPTGDTPK